MKFKRILHRTIRVISIILVSLLVLTGAGLALLQTGPARRFVAQKITALLGEQLGPGSAVRVIEGFLPFSIRVRDIKLCDRQGEFLRLKKFAFRFSPSQLLRLRIRIDELSADRVVFKRLPESGPDTEKTPEDKDGGGFPSDLPALELSRLSIRELILGKDLAGERTRLHLDGNLSYDPDRGLLTALKITGTSSPFLKVSIEGRSTTDLQRLKLRIGVSEGAGGILSRMIDLPDAGPISLNIQGEGPVDRLHTNLEIDIKEIVSIHGLMDLDLPRPGAEGKLTLTIDDLNTLCHLTGDPISGSLRSSIKLSCPGERQNGSIMVDIRDLSTAGVTAAQAKLSINLEDILASPSGDLDLSLANLDYNKIDGTAIRAETTTCSLRLAGPPHKPSLNLSLRVEEITSPSFPLDSPVPVAFSLEARLKENRFHSKMELSGRSDLRLKADGSGPAKITLSPFSFDLPADGEIEGNLAAKIDLGLLTALEALSRQSLTGILSLNFSAGGTLKTPQYQGRLKIEDGEYQNLELGTVLTDLQADIALNNSKIKIERFEASGPGTGKLTLNGNITLSPEKNYPFSSTLVLSTLELANTDDYQAAATGKITAAGKIDAMDITGEINIDRAQFRIPKTSPPSVTGIPVIEINKPGDSGTVTSPEPSPLLKNIGLDLAIKSAGCLTVSGRGLNSTWGADLTIGGTAGGPEIKGGLKLSGGYFIFLGKHLDLANCSISMDGGIPLTPQLNINAQANSGGILINLQIIGSPERPKLILTSQPPFPPDEILARLLFGKDRSSLNAIEGARITYGLQVLQGGNDIVDYLTGWTSFLGGPELNLTQYANDPSVTAVSTRWNLSDDISVENQKSLTGSGDLVIFYLNLTRRLQLMSITGVSGAGDGARVRWHYDF